jgi:ABC-type multidrug transport system fused ATPase/permease subunit
MWLAGSYVIVAAVLRMTFWHLGYRLFTSAREQIIFGLRARFFRHVNDLCLRFHGQHPSGELFSYVFGSPLNSVMEFFRQMSMSVPGSVVLLIFTQVLFWKWDWVVACVLLVFSTLSVMMMMRSRRFVELIQRDYQSTEGNVSGRVADMLRGNRAVKLHAMEARVIVDFEAQAQLIARKSYERDVRSHFEGMKQEGLSYVFYAAVMVVCAWRYFGGHIDLGVVAACLVSYVGLTAPLQTIFMAFLLWGGAAAALERIGSVLDTPSTTPDPTGDSEPVPAAGVFEFDHVNFAYEPGSPVLTDLSLTIPPGERVAFVGPSGAGKTTIAQMLLRFYDPQEGTVRLNGRDLRHFAGTELRRQFGVVPQDPFIFQTSLRNNLLVARGDASDAEIRRACELANAWEFIAALPGGLDAHVGEGGASLSGGQRQRLAIARALLSEPQFFIFDEATSALDTLSEKLIQEALEQNLGDRTVIFIAHRLSTVKHCDRIIVMAGGRIVQQGSYDELIASDGLFAELVRGQQLRE